MKWKLNNLIIHKNRNLKDIFFKKRGFYYEIEFEVSQKEIETYERFFFVLCDLNGLTIFLNKNTDLVILDKCFITKTKMTDSDIEQLILDKINEFKGDSYCTFLIFMTNFFEPLFPIWELNKSECPTK